MRKILALVVHGRKAASIILATWEASQIPTEIDRTR